MLVAILLATAFPVLDRIDIVGGWSVNRSKDGTCGIEGTVNGREYFLASNPEFPNHYVVGVGSTTWQSIVETKEYPLSIISEKNVLSDRGFGKNGVGSYKFVIGVLERSSVDNAVMKKRSLRFVMEGKDVGEVQFSLLALGAVNRCGNTASDPFKGK